MPAAPRFLTVGHANHPPERFLGLLARFGVTAVADVRSRPFASFSRHFDGERLRPALRAAGIGYVFLPDLGGKPAEDRWYDADGHVRYDLLAARPGFAAAIDRLWAGADRHRIALMCGEEDPAGCHRHLLVGRVLAERGAEVAHIRADGRLVPAADLAPPPTLFDVAPPWRSAWRRRPAAEGEQGAEGPEG